MARFFMISIAIILVIFALSDVSARRCKCTDSIQCRTRYCRDGRCIKFGDNSNDVGTNPCSIVRCDGFCVLQQVQCVRFPCPPVARCVRCTKELCN